MIACIINAAVLCADGCLERSYSGRVHGSTNTRVVSTTVVPVVLVLPAQPADCDLIAAVLCASMANSSPAAECATAAAVPSRRSTEPADARHCS